MQQIPIVEYHQIPSLRTWACRQRPGLSFTSCSKAPSARDQAPYSQRRLTLSCVLQTIHQHGYSRGFGQHRKVNELGKQARSRAPTSSAQRISSSGHWHHLLSMLALFSLQQSPVSVVTCTPKGSDGRFPPVGSSCSAQHASDPNACIKLIQTYSITLLECTAHDHASTRAPSLVYRWTRPWRPPLHRQMPGSICRSMLLTLRRRKCRL
jgi:hypothetical protein